MRAKKLQRFDIPFAVVEIVLPLIADYNRRRYMQESDTITAETRRNYARINDAIDAALNDVEPGLRADLVKDIKMRRGYYKSEAQFIISKNAYYQRRRKLIHDVAENLSLI